MSKKIIVIDDSDSTRKEVGVVLRGAGYEVVEAVDGSDGLDKIRKTAGAAMVICDVNMPKMDGLAMVEAVQKDGKHTALPIVMLTTEMEQDMVKRAKAAGVKGWIVKPFNDALLLATVKKLAGPA